MRGKKVLINCEQLSLRFHISYHSLDDDDDDEWIVIKPQVREPHTNNEREREREREREGEEERGNKERGSKRGGKRAQNPQISKQVPRTRAINTSNASQSAVPELF